MRLGPDRLCASQSHHSHRHAPGPPGQLSAKLPEVRALFAGFHIEEVETHYSTSATATHQVGELLISGGDSPRDRSRDRPGQGTPISSPNAARNWASAGLSGNRARNNRA